MTQNLWLAVTAAVLLQSPFAAAQVHNNGVKTACINNNCRSKALPRHYKTVPTRRISPVSRSLAVFENNLSGTKNAYFANSRNACDKGFRFQIASNGSGVCSPRRTFSPSLNTNVGKALNDRQLDDTTLTPSNESGPDVSQDVRERVQAAREVFPDLNQTRDPVEQVEEVVEAQSFRQSIPEDYSTPRQRRSLQRQTVQMVNNSFNAANIKPLDENMFKNTFAIPGVHPNRCAGKRAQSRRCQE